MVNIFKKDLFENYFSINTQEKMKTITKIFRFLVSKNVEVIKFNVVNDTLTYDGVYSVIIKKSFFNDFKITNRDIIKLPLINIIKDMQSYKGKKVFPHVYFIFSESNLTIKSVYNNEVELTNIINNEFSNVLNTFTLPSYIQNKHPDFTFEISIDKINILLNNSYIKEYCEFNILNNLVTIIFLDTHSDKKIIKSNLSSTNQTNFNFKLNNALIKDLMKFFKENTAVFDIFTQDLKIITNIKFGKDIHLNMITKIQDLKNEI